MRWAEELVLLNAMGLSNSGSPPTFARVGDRCFTEGEVLLPPPPLKMFSLLFKSLSKLVVACLEEDVLEDDD